MKAIETIYNGYEFRSRLEARWAVFFDTLGVKWEYEPEHYDLGLKHPWLHDDYDFKEYLQEELDNNDGYADREDVIRDVYREKYERQFYLPDFHLPTFHCWVEIKGKPPTAEEQSKARNLTYYTQEPIHILWGNIPDPQAKVWGECSEVFHGDMGILALLTLEYGVRAIQHAFTVARRARFEK